MRRELLVNPPPIIIIRMHDLSTLGFDHSRIVVLGDAMLDSYVLGSVERVSPEAPVPVLRELDRRSTPGAAANVAHNIAGLGGTVTLVTVVGDDNEGGMLADTLRSAAISLSAITDRDRPTTVKTRVMAGGQQLVRIDREIVAPVSQTIAEQLLDATCVALEGASVLVLSDYGKGCLTDYVLAKAIEEAQRRDIPILIDPKRPDFTAYCGATLIKPNRSELSRATGLACNSDEEAARAAQHVIELTGANVLLTQSERGMALFRADAAPIHIETGAREVFDVSGAGDTVIALMALGAAAKLPIEQAMRVANHAAGIVVSKRGTATISPDELAHSLDRENTDVAKSDGAVSRHAAIAFRRSCAVRGLTVGFTNGCFDLLHPGHIELLRGAAAQCDRLIVALNTDASVKRLKGPSRPIQTQENRAVVMAALSDVALVTLFDEDTPLALIKALEPDVLIKGADYTEEQIVGASFVKDRGGRVCRIALVDGQSTSAMIDRGNQVPLVDVG